MVVVAFIIGCSFLYLMDTSILTWVRVLIVLV